MHRRGRSRIVSPVALARQASEERKTMPPSTRHKITLKEVIDARKGALFPRDDARRIVSCPHKRKSLDVLLQVVDWEKETRRLSKGKDIQPPPPTPILSVSTTNSSRSSSWLSFGSWRSTATDITTPDSPVLLSPTCQPCLLPTLVDQPELHPHSAFVRISLEESPLGPPPIPPILDNHIHPPSPTPPLRIRGALVKHVSRSVATLIDAAKGLQSAYITATMFAVGSLSDSASQPLQYQRQLRPEGYRALAKHVRILIDASPIHHYSLEPVHFIPLAPSGNTVVPTPPIPKNTILFPSPLRPRTPPSALAYRMRPIANPALLRLRALQNLMYARGKQWEGHAREGALGCGKERMLGIAFEGRGRSGLGCEVRFVVA